MTPPAAAGVAAVLLALSLFGLWRSLRARRRDLALLQPLAALAFYLLLFPPATGLRGDTLSVLTPGASEAQRRALPGGQPAVALPGVQPGGRAQPVPDLATALRRLPSVTRLEVIGGGLPARDREAAQGYALRFAPAPAQGLQELQAPAKVTLGSAWTLGGRVAQAGAVVELLDPAGSVIDSVAADREGRFRLAGSARGAGPQRFELRVYDAGRDAAAAAPRGPADRSSVPLIVQPGVALDLLLRAGAPDPELKYFRRWAADAGFALRAAVGLSDNLLLRDGDAAFTAASLAAADLVLLDERAWLALRAEEKSALLAAVDGGLGLLLRASALPEPPVAADWSALGFELAGLAAPRSVTLDRRTGLRERAAFTAAPVAVKAPQAAVLLADDSGAALGWWLPRGQGRVGMWTLADSYRLQLLGEPARYDALWAQTLARLARPRAQLRDPLLPQDARVDQRAVFCALDGGASVLSPGGVSTGLLAVGDPGCAAYWPAEPGWHRLRMVEAAWPFYVRAADDAVNLARAADARATAQMAAAVDDVPAAALQPAPMSRWPFFFAWLTLAALLWWRERF